MHVFFGLKNQGGSCRCGTISDTLKQQWHWHGMARYLMLTSLHHSAIVVFRLLGQNISSGMYSHPPIPIVSQELQIKSFILTEQNFSCKLWMGNAQAVSTGNLYNSLLTAHLVHLHYACHVVFSGKRGEREGFENWLRAVFHFIGIAVWWTACGVYSTVRKLRHRSPLTNHCYPPLEPARRECANENATSIVVWWDRPRLFGRGSWHFHDECSTNNIAIPSLLESLGVFLLNSANSSLNHFCSSCYTLLIYSVKRFNHSL